MPLPDRRAPSRAPRRKRVRFARGPLRFILRACHLVLVAIAAGLGAQPPPRLLRHEDPIAQVADEE